jgi:hypothetical protein
MSQDRRSKAKLNLEQEDHRQFSSKIFIVFKAASEYNKQCNNTTTISEDYCTNNKSVVIRTIEDQTTTYTAADKNRLVSGKSNQDRQDKERTLFPFRKGSTPGRYESLAVLIDSV